MHFWATLIVVSRNPTWVCANGFYKIPKRTKPYPIWIFIVNTNPPPNYSQHTGRSETETFGYDILTVVCTTLTLKNIPKKEQRPAAVPMYTCTCTCMCTLQVIIIIVTDVHSYIMYCTCTRMQTLCVVSFGNMITLRLGLSVRPSICPLWKVSESNLTLRHQSLYLGPSSIRNKK